jgi:hypothetical protein
MSRRTGTPQRCPCRENAYSASLAQPYFSSLPGRSSSGRDNLWEDRCEFGTEGNELR